MYVWLSLEIPGLSTRRIVFIKLSYILFFFFLYPIFCVSMFTKQLLKMNFELFYLHAEGEVLFSVFSFLPCE